MWCTLPHHHYAPPPCAPPTQPTSIDDAMEKGLGCRAGTRSRRYWRGKWAEAEGKSASTYREGRGEVGRGGEGRGGEGRGGVRRGGEDVLLSCEWQYLCDGPSGSIAVGKQLLLRTRGRGRGQRRGRGWRVSTTRPMEACPSSHSPVLLQW